jgi:hypothetical protein
MITIRVKLDGNSEEDFKKANRRSDFEMEMDSVECLMWKQEHGTCKGCPDEFDCFLLGMSILLELEIENKLGG